VQSVLSGALLLVRSGLATRRPLIAMLGGGCQGF